jgi:putative hemolysin
MAQEKKLVNTADALDQPLNKLLYTLFIKAGVEKALGIDKLNKVHQTLAKRSLDNPARYAEEALKVLNIQYQLPTAEIEKLRKIEGPVVMVCNHPYGGIEALLLIVLLSQIRDDYRIMANFILGRIDELKDSFFLVDPFDTESSKIRNVGVLKQVLQYMQTGGLLGVFPSGEVAALDLKTKQIREPEWSPNISRLILKTKATVIPIYFHGSNSMLFQLAGIIHPRLRTGLLIREFVNPPSYKLVFRIGKLIPAEKIQQFSNADDLSKYLRSKTYLLGRSYKPPTQSKLNWVKPLKQVLKREQQQDIIPPVPCEILANEISNLPAECFLLSQNEMDVLVFRSTQAPATMIELGRLRETTFRQVGEGTGKSLDVDDYDSYYEQMIIWNNKQQEIVGAYRIARCDEVIQQKGLKGLYVNSLFDIDPAVYQRIDPALELGRSIVRQEYQRSYVPLMLLWTGIGHYLARYPRYRYLMGPVSISNAFHSVSKYFIVAYLQKEHFLHDFDGLIKARNPFKMDIKANQELYENLTISNLEDIQEVISYVEQEDTRVPILIKHYLKLGSKVLAFNVDPHFQDAVDALVLTSVPDVPYEVLRKYMSAEGLTHYLEHHHVTANNTPKKRSTPPPTPSIE